ncbi:MAG: hypothetical protein MRECE_46c006 [Mycoplasmataceae bacterium CE_OT135]|nr:MAG: hypothetical protein MRECE_46c006 [Mycoplasmataceae bacterium CE_OT135]
MKWWPVRAGTYHKLKERANKLVEQVETLSKKLEETKTPDLQQELKKIQEEIRLIRELTKKTAKGKESEEEVIEEGGSSSSQNLEQVQNERLEAEKRRNEKLQTQLTHAQTELNEERNRANQLQLNLTKEKKKIGPLQRKSAQLRQQLKESEEAQNQLTLAVTNKQNELNEKEQNYNNLRIQLKNVLRSLHDLQEENRQLQKDIAERGVRPDITQQQWIDAQNQINLLQAELQKEQQAHQQTQTRFDAIPTNWQEQLNNLLQIIDELTKTNERLEKEHEQELARLKSQKNALQSSLEEERRKVELLHETHKVLNEEKQELQKVVSFSQGNVEKITEQLVKSQQTIEKLEKELFSCCDECLIEKEKQEKNLAEGKQEIFQLCQRLNVPLSERLKEKIESTTTYWGLVQCLKDIHDKKTITEVQQVQENEQAESKTFSSVSSPQGGVNSGTKYFLWATGILALIGLIFTFVRGKIKGTKKK